MTFDPDFSSDGRLSRSSPMSEICSDSDQTNVRLRMELPFGHPLARDGAGKWLLLLSVCWVGISS